MTLLQGVPAHLDDQLVAAELEEEVHRGVAAPGDRGGGAHHQVLARGVFDVVGAVSELQREDVLAGAVGIQDTRDLAAANEAVVPAEHDHEAVDQFHEEELRVPCCLHQGSQVAILPGRHKLAIGRTQYNPLIMPLDVKVAAGVLGGGGGRHTPGGCQHPVLARVGAEGALFGRAVHLQLENLLVGLFILTGRQVHSLARGHVPLVGRLQHDLGSALLQGGELVLPHLGGLALMAPGSGPRSRGKPPCRSRARARSRWRARGPRCSAGPGRPA